MPRFVLTREAALDLKDIWDYVAQENPSAADRIAADIVSAFEHLARWPRTGHTRPEITPETILWWPIRKYMVAYVVEDGVVSILAIFHGARDLPAAMQQRRPKPPA